MSSRSVAACLLAWLLLTPTANAQTPTDAMTGSLGRAVRECPHVTIFDDVDARVDGGSVLLTGKVTASSKKEEIERRVAKIEGVSEVRNEIAVLPPLSSDDDLRHRVARAIYGNPTFWTYAAMSNPPIHIIVERGHVVLRGTVNSNVERTMARTLASGLGERSLINELRTEGR
jgi:osmotically-inducible protein OsmY